MVDIFTPEILSLIIALIIGIPTLSVMYFRVKGKFTEFRELVVTLDEAWKDDRISEEEWKSVFDKLMRLVITDTTKQPGS